MFTKGCSLDCVVSVACVPYLISCWADCIVLLFYLYLTIVILYGHLHLFSFLEDLNVFILNFVHWFKDFPAAFWLNVDIFMVLLLFTELFIGFHHCIWQIFLGMLQLLPPALEETKLFVPRVRTSYGINSFYYKGIQIWNSLNASIYAATSLAQFKQL